MFIQITNPMFSKNIYFLRNKYKLSRAEFQKQVGVNGGMLYCIERELFYGIDKRYLNNICSFFNVTVQSLLEEDLSIKMCIRSDLMETTHYLYYFAKNIAYLRKKESLTQKQMASIMNVGVGIIQKLEKGIPAPGMNCYAPLLLSQYFHISLDALWKTELKD